MLPIARIAYERFQPGYLAGVMLVASTVDDNSAGYYCERRRLPLRVVQFEAQILEEGIFVSVYGGDQPPAVRKVLEEERNALAYLFRREVIRRTRIALSH